MAFRVRDKDGKPRRVNALRAISDPKGFRAQIEQIRNGGKRSVSSSAARDEKTEMKATATSDKAQKTDKDMDKLEKKRMEILTQLQKLTLEVAEINNQVKNEESSKKGAELATDHETSAISEKIDIDPRWPESIATKADFEDMDVEEAERLGMTLEQCALLLQLNEHYDKVKYEAIAARFFDSTSIRIDAAEMKLMAEGGSRMR